MGQEHTDPTTPDPAAQGTDPGNQPDPTPNPDPAAQDTGNGDDRASRQAARYRTERNELQQQLDAVRQEQQELVQRLTAALGGDPADSNPDPAAQVGELTGQVQTLTTELQQARAELLVHELAGDHNANAVALLDSRTFTTSLHGLDPAADDYREQVASAIKDAVGRNATLRSKGQGPARGGAPGAGQGSAQPDGGITQEQFDAMGIKARSELFRTNPDLYRRLAGN